MPLFGNPTLTRTAPTPHTFDTAFLLGWLSPTQPTQLYGYVGGNPVNLVDPLGLFYCQNCHYETPRNPIIQPIVDWINPEPPRPDPYKNEEKESVPSTHPDDWEKIPRSKPPAYRPKGDKEPVFQKDQAGDRSHGGSAWKKWNKHRDWEKGKTRDGTYNEEGCRLRD